MDAFRDSSSSSYRCSYHAFLSFRGQDTRRGFTDHLYRALELAGIHTFRDDDEIKRGENIESELEKAIQESQVSIIVFSKDYASSRWCLNELLKIVERRNTDHRHVVLPVFYDVDPSDVRKQSGTFAKAFARHEERFSTEMDKVEQWRRALGDVASLGGMVLGDRYEGQFIQDVVEEISNKLDPAALDVAPFAVGIDNRVQDLNMWLQDGSNDVGVAVICGMGGIGKSTIVKAAYNQNFDRFQGSSFLADIRESSEQPNGFARLQRKLLLDIQKGNAKKVYNVAEGISRIKRAVGYKRVLIVLDDVNSRDQLNAILGMREWLHPGSKIIITTRHEHLLNAHEVCEKFMVRELDEDESLELFSWHAFGQSHPVEGYMELSRHVVQHCGGLPLAIQVLGSSLSGKSVEVWQSALQKLDVIPNDKIQKVLRISFDSLHEDHDQNLFLHIASFFTGKTMDYIITILDNLEFCTRVGIENLVDRCLVTIQGSKLVMHQLLRNMAMAIIRKESPHDPGKRSRVLQNDASNILRKLSGTENIKGLMLNLASKRTFVGSDNKRYHAEDYDGNCSRRRRLGFFSWKPVSFSSTNSASASNEIDFKSEAFRRMHNLEILMLNNVNVRGSYEEFSKKLVCLSWRGFHLKSIPENFCLENLVVLDMRNSSLQHVWNETRVIPRLKILNFSHSHGLRTVPDFSGLYNLERLILKHCINLVEVHESIGNLEKLAVLNLEGCKNLMKLPVLRSIQDLILSGCSKLEMKKLNLVSAKSWYSVWSWVSPRKHTELSSFSLASLPRSLISLSLDCCNISEIPSALTMLSSLEYLDLDGNLITSLPESMNNLVKLQTLKVSGCRNLTILPELPRSLTCLTLACCNISEIPSALTMLSSLEYLDLDGNPITSLPESMNNLVKLQTLKVSGCRNLTILPELPCSLTSLTLACCNISEIPSALTMLSSLEKLDLSCNPITSLPESMNNLVKLQTLKVSGCRNLTILPELPHSLTSLTLACCNISEIPSALTMLSSLEKLDLSYNPITSLPESMNNLVKLQTLKVSGCRNLTILPELPRSLTGLTLACCNISEIPSALTMQSSLEYLDLDGNPITSLPESMNNLVKLQTLKVSGCRNLTILPELPRSLTCLTLACCNISEIPSALTMQPSLEYLDLDCNPITSLPESMNNLVKLQTLKVSGCRNLTILPELPRSLTCLTLACCNISEIPSALTMLSSLEYLDLDGNLITSLPESMNNLVKLQTLKVSGCRNLTILPELPRSLTCLTLACCNISEIPSALTMLSSLEYLDLDGNPITSLPESMNNLVKLQTLKVSGCRNLTILPELPCSLTSLTLACCNISEIPSALTMLSSLEKLDLSCNPITSLPESMNNLVKLQTLKVSGCRNLTILPELPHSLTSLTLACCNISEIPSALTMLSSLEKLDLSYNPITSLPESMNNLVKLQTLKVSGCRNLTILPELPRSLTSLTLACCNISEIPSALTMLSSLEYLDLDGNLITSLPESMNNLVKLQTLKVSGCKNLTMLPELPRS
ncbi:hypothetical protein ACFXTO_026068 [Malus domestica]